MTWLRSCLAFVRREVSEGVLDTPSRAIRSCRTSGPLAPSCLRLGAGHQARTQWPVISTNPIFSWGIPSICVCFISVPFNNCIYLSSTTLSFQIVDITVDHIISFRALNSIWFSVLKRFKDTPDCFVHVLIKDNESAEPPHWVFLRYQLWYFIPLLSLRLKPAT